MHTRKLLLTFSICAAFVLGACQTQSSEDTESTPPPGALVAPALSVTIEPVATSTTTRSSTFLGKLEAAQRIEVKPEASGRVSSTEARSGQYVQEGQVLAVLKSESNTARLEGARANAAAQKAAVEVAQTQLPIAESQVRTAEIEAELARKNYELYSDLADEGAYPRHDVEVARRDLLTAREQVKQAELEVASTRASIEQARLLYEQTLTEITLEEESVVTTQITAPLSGLIDEMDVSIGDVVTSESLVTTIVDNSLLNLHLAVPSRLSEDLKPGLRVELLEPGDRQVIASGTIRFISPLVQQESQSIVASAQFENRDGSLRDGQLVNATIKWASQESILIPTTAVTRLAGQSFVFVYNSEDGVAKQKTVQLGDLQDGRYKVLSGLQEGEQLITSGVPRLRNNAPVVIEGD